jgi:hypothetical protein
MDLEFNTALKVGIRYLFRCRISKRSFSLVPIMRVATKSWIF